MKVKENLVAILRIALPTPFIRWLENMGIRIVLKLLLFFKGKLRAEKHSLRLILLEIVLFVSAFVIWQEIRLRRISSGNGTEVSIHWGDD